MGCRTLALPHWTGKVCYGNDRDKSGSEDSCHSGSVWRPGAPVGATLAVAAFKNRMSPE